MAAGLHRIASLITKFIPSATGVTTMVESDAHAISLGAIIPISIAGIATYGIAGEVRWWDALALAAGSIVGAQVGVGVLTRIDERLLKVIFGGFLIGVAALLGVKA